MNIDKLLNDYLSLRKVSEICKEQNISRSTFYRTLKKYKIDTSKRYDDGLTNNQRMQKRKITEKECLLCKSKDLFLDKKYCYYHWLKFIYKGIRNRIKRDKFYKKYETSFNAEQFINWGLKNRPVGLKKPSIDRIDNNKGYSLDNIRWLEISDNLRRQTQDMVEEGYRRCPKCKKIYPATPQYFNKKINKPSKHGVDGKCKKCRKIYIHIFRYNKGILKKLKYTDEDYYK
jgi:hypothetical protein